ncbi:WYL domain-containing protein [Niveispirillum sp. BGYR6]|uniref:helix-turn-helix transcriptional regulator n=1 Tax=Niveispirillum sp. BGYR6 TaxID=2971249 RepID=UPI0022B99AAF|nr:WYL domain-containing protein [Niveispirillum sp. BGYR6]MDG5497908.1 WYL domain-containing protein [Niveispirillum sp. BGYR6]
MPRKKTDALPRDKLLVLYQRLTLGHRKHFQGDLARDLGCSPQTVARLIGVVERHLGKDVEIESGLEGRRRYYRLRSLTQAKTFGFSFEELDYLALCREIGASFLPAAIAERIDQSLMSLALQLAEGQQRHSPRGGIYFRPKGCIDYGPHLPTISTLRQAIENRQVCAVHYRAQGRGDVRLHRYAPGRILATNGTLYVQGYRLADGSLLADRTTTFSLHRIVTVDLTGEYFRFNAADATARAFGLDWHDPRRFQVRVAAPVADYVRDRMWSEDQVIRDQDDGGIILTVTTTSEKELHAWVSSFGGLAQVVSVTESSTRNDKDHEHAG